MTKPTREQLHAALLHIAEPKNRCDAYGICRNVHLALAELFSVFLDEEEASPLAEFWQSWPQFTGRNDYPIPHGGMGCRPAYRRLVLWPTSASVYYSRVYDEEYIRLRLDLLNHLIQETAP